MTEEALAQAFKTIFPYLLVLVIAWGVVRAVFSIFSNTKVWIACAVLLLFGVPAAFFADVLVAMGTFAWTVCQQLVAATVAA